MSDFPRDLGGWLAHLEGLHPRGQAGIELGLDRARRVADVLGQRPACPVITVGGTNGKGSTCALIERILLAAGYRVGLYTSPHLTRYNERVRLQGIPVSDEELCAAFAKVERARGDLSLTYFEFGTLAAMEAFLTAGLDVIVLEVGLGGRLDATNVYDADCAIVTTIALDHMDYLGPDRASIGREKAGIGRCGKPLICGDAQPPASVIESCRLAGVDFLQLGVDFGYTHHEHQWQYWGKDGRKRGGLAFPALRGTYQLANASCALAALDAVRDRLPVTAQDIRRGLAEVEVAGRCQVLPGRPQVVLDVAHNPQAAQALAGNLGGMGFASETWAILGMMADKDIDGVIAALYGRVDHWLVCDVPGPRAAAAGQLATIIEKVDAGKTATCFISPAEALAYAQEHAAGDARILAFGSFLTVADVMRALGRAG